MNVKAFECLYMLAHSALSSSFLLQSINVHIFYFYLFFFARIFLNFFTNKLKKNPRFIQHTIFSVYMFVYDMKRNWIFQFISKCICFYIYTIKLTLSFHSISHPILFFLLIHIFSVLLAFFT